MINDGSNKMSEKAPFNKALNIKIWGVKVNKKDKIGYWFCVIFKN